MSVKPGNERRSEVLDTANVHDGPIMLSRIAFPDLGANSKHGDLAIL